MQPLEQLLPGTFDSLMVASIIVAVMVVRYATQNDPVSAVRTWATRIAVGAVIVWFASGLLHQAKASQNLLQVALSRAFVRGVIAILLVWAALSDEI